MANHATFGQRLAAIIIDHVILFIIVTILAIPFGLQTAFLSSAGLGNPMLYANMWGIYTAITIVIWIVYFTYLEGRNGQTIGKMALRIKVVREKGTLDYGTSFVRNILRIIDWLPFVYILGFIVGLASENNQRIGDHAARTVVVKA